MRISRRSRGAPRMMPAAAAAHSCAFTRCSDGSGWRSFIKCLQQLSGDRHSDHCRLLALDAGNADGARQAHDLFGFETVARQARAEPGALAAGTDDTDPCLIA